MSSNGHSESVPACDLDAEAAVLSSVLIKPSCLDELGLLLGPTEFYADANRRVWEAVLALDSAGQEIDTVSVASWLKDKGRLAQIGGTPYLGQLTDATPAISHVQTHARIVADKAAIRRVVSVCQVAAAEGYGDIGHVESWLQDVERRVFEATRTNKREDTGATMRELIVAEQKDMVERQKAPAKVTGIKTGLASLDRKINGLKRGIKYTVAGRPGHGKTALALCISTGVAKGGDAVVFISLEMPRKQLAQRAIAQGASLDTQDVERGDLNGAQWKAAAASFESLAKLPIYVDDAGSHTIGSIRSAVRRGMSKLRVQHGQELELGLVVVDYLQIMTPRERNGRSRENEISELSGGLRELAKEFRAPVLELSQLSRACELRPDKRPILSDLRDSGSIEQDAFGIMFVYRDDEYKPKDAAKDGKAEIIIRKMRQGGSTGTVELGFQAHSTRFYEIEPEPDQYFGPADNEQGVEW